MWVVVEKIIDFVSQKAKNFLLFRPSIKLSVEGCSQYYDKELKAIRIMILLGLTNSGPVLNTIRKISYESLTPGWTIDVEKINITNNFAYLEEHGFRARINADGVLLLPLNIQPGETKVKYIFLKTDSIPSGDTKIKISVVDSHKKTYELILDVNGEKNDAI